MDVLDDALMPAVDDRIAGGLSWEELTAILGAAMSTGRVVGVTVTIFNPTLDPDRGLAARLVQALVEGLGP